MVWKKNNIKVSNPNRISISIYAHPCGDTCPFSTPPARISSVGYSLYESYTVEGKSNNFFSKLYRNSDRLTVTRSGSQLGSRTSRGLAVFRIWQRRRAAGRRRAESGQPVKRRGWGRVVAAVLPPGWSGKAPVANLRCWFHSSSQIRKTFQWSNASTSRGFCYV